MSREVLDTVGMQCPQPVLKLAVRAAEMHAGDTLEIVGDCPTFERDIREWCRRLGKAMLSITEESGNAKRITIAF